jgi:hypothetical protein
MNGAAFSSETYEHDHERDSCRLIFCIPAIARAARYTSVLFLADQMRQALERWPARDPTAKRTLPPGPTSRAALTIGTSATSHAGSPQRG